MDSLRTASECIGKYDDGSGYRCHVRVGFDDRLEPVVSVTVGRDTAAFGADDWPVIREAIERMLAFVGQHPDKS